MKNKGITLVALIITIIILLILSGITIGQLQGSGLFENAKTAKEKYENAQELENGILSDYEKAINTGKIDSTRENEENSDDWKASYDSLKEELDALKAEVNTLKTKVPEYTITELASTTETSEETIVNLVNDKLSNYKFVMVAFRGGTSTYFSGIVPVDLFENSNKYLTANGPLNWNNDSYYVPQSRAKYSSDTSIYLHANNGNGTVHTAILYGIK